MVVDWLVFLNLVKLYVLVADSNCTKSSSSLLSYLITILSASTYSTTPFPSALIKILESVATCFSKPVPTIGASGFNNGTA